MQLTLIKPKYNKDIAQMSGLHDKCISSLYLISGRLSAYLAVSL